MPTTYENVDKKAAAKKVDDAAKENEKRAKGVYDDDDDTEEAEADKKVKAAKGARDAAEPEKSVNVNADGGKPEAADHRPSDQRSGQDGPSVSSRPGPHGENG